MTVLRVEERGGDLSFRVRATPRARASALAGVDDEGVLRVRVAAPPVEGKANDALCAFLAGSLGIRASAVRIASGEGSRYKIVVVTGVSRERLTDICGGVP